MAASGAEVVVNAWKHWGLQSLVLLSFMLQVTLLILAEFRRFIDSGVLRAFVWSAYTLADGTAIYVLGHLSVASRPPSELELMALWAPFLLLHLGGQDNITAYAIEDNRLWLRHLQTLAVQVAAAAYVVYQSSVVLVGWRSSLLWPATILVSVVGVLKYGERVWALRCANSSGAGHNYRNIERYQLIRRHQFKGDEGSGVMDLDTEAFLRIAHELLEVPKDLLIEGWQFTEGLETDLSAKELYKVGEMQLSLMHDFFYTKTPVIHSWNGLCIRVTSLVCTLVAFLLLLLLHLLGGHRGPYSRLDVGVTCVLLVGAVTLEIVSVLRVMFSSGTFAFLEDWRHKPSNSIWHWLARVVSSVRRLVHAADWTRRCCWSRSMGQHNMLRLCARSRASWSSRVARWMGVEDPWNMLAYSWSVPVTTFLEQLIVTQLLNNRERRNQGRRWRPEQIITAQGREAMQRWGLYGDLNWSAEESILVWHIATDIYLYWYKEGEEQRKSTAPARWRDDVVEAAEVLSNYMLYLLAARPHMLPPSADREAYVQMCHAMLAPKGKRTRNYDILSVVEFNSAQDLATSLRHLVSSPIPRAATYPVSSDRENAAMWEIGAKLGVRLIGEDQFLQGSSTAGDKLDMIVQVWLDMLFYLASRCSAYSHAKQLGNGGDLITVAALFMKYITQGMHSDE